MSNLKYAVLGYKNVVRDGGGNYGDEIKSIAATFCLSGVDTVIDRNELNQFSNSDKHVLLMNGFFAFERSGEYAFPPSSDIVPIYFGFHIAGSEPSKAFYTSPFMSGALQKIGTNWVSRPWNSRIVRK